MANWTTYDDPTVGYDDPLTPYDGTDSVRKMVCLTGQDSTEVEVEGSGAESC